METSDISNELRDFIRTNYEIGEDDDEFTDDVHLFDYGYIDSFGAVELTSFVEKQFGVEVTDTDLITQPLNTVNEITVFIQKRKSGEV
ncbi:MAG: acyl carrier protein [Planctomycetota bacterium]|jgi:D-alanine--poly(phosphoribitol) ligase subunit 2